MTGRQTDGSVTKRSKVIVTDNASQPKRVARLPLYSERLPKGYQRSREGSLSGPSLGPKSAMSARFGQHSDGRDLSLLRIESGGLTRCSTDAGCVEVFHVQGISCRCSHHEPRRAKHTKHTHLEIAVTWRPDSGAENLGEELAPRRRSSVGLFRLVHQHDHWPTGFSLLAS